MSKSPNAQVQGKITTEQFAQIESKKYRPIRSHVFCFEDLGITSVMVEVFAIPLLQPNEGEVPRDVATIALYVSIDKLKDTLPIFYVFNEYTRNFFIFNDLLKAADLIKYLQMKCKALYQKEPGRSLMPELTA